MKQSKRLIKRRKRLDPNYGSKTAIEQLVETVSFEDFDLRLNDLITLFLTAFYLLNDGESIVLISATEFPDFIPVHCLYENAYDNHFEKILKTHKVIIVKERSGTRIFAVELSKIKESYEWGIKRGYKPSKQESYVCPND